MNIRTTACLIGALLIAGVSAAQTPVRRATSPAALLAYPGFFQGQPVVIRGQLATRDQPVLTSPDIDRAIPLIFTGTSPDDGPVELRATFWDIGRLQRDDPRLTSLGLVRMLPKGVEGDWPRPGEVIVLIASSATAVKPSTGATSLREIALDPMAHAGEKVTVTGQFRGMNLYGDVPQAPGLTQWDFVLHSADAAVWVTGLRPRGKGFNLDVGARVDTRAWLQATGTVRTGRGLVWIEAIEPLTIAKPDTSFVIEPIPPPPMGASPEVIFSDPQDGETDVPIKRAIRVQFSRDLNPDTLKGNVRWRYAGTSAGDEPQNALTVKYEKSNRSAEIKLDGPDLIKFRGVTIEFADAITAADGARLKPWSMTFTFAGQ